MMLESIINDYDYLLIPDNLKKKVIKYLNSMDNLYQIKVITLSEFKKKTLFDYNEEDIYYVMNKYSFNYSNATEYIQNMYYALRPCNKKIDSLLDAKNDLINNNMLSINKVFVEFLKKKKILVYGFSYLDRFTKEILKDYNYKVYEINDNDYKHDVYEFSNNTNEIEAVCNDIISKNLDFNHVFIANMNKDYESTIKRVFNNYNIKINIKNTDSIYDTYEGLNLLNNLSDYENYINSVKNVDIKNNLISIINKYAWISDKNLVKELILNDLKKCKCKSDKYNYAVNEIELFDNFVNDDDYIYLIGFNREYLPITYKDTDYITDKEKTDYMENTNLKNIIEEDKWIKVISNIRNLWISYSLENLSGSIHPSSLVSKYDVIKKDFLYSLYSNKSNTYNLSVILDDYLKYGNQRDKINPLIDIYPNINYLSYSNKYHNIGEAVSSIKLSYSKMNTYYECGFKYYCDNILRLRKYEDTFDTFLGSLCHFILSKIYDADFDFNKAYMDFISESKYELTLENKVYLAKIMDELKIAINFNMKHYKETLYKDIECEKEINVDVGNEKFIGIIDKIMKYDNKISLVDYKTGNTMVDIKLAKYGLNLQLPTYIWLIKSVYPQSKITGIYLEHIIKPSTNMVDNKSFDEVYEDHLKLYGYTLGNEDDIREFDPSFENSVYIKSMKMTSNGFYKYSKVLTESEFDDLINLTNEKVLECIKRIKSSDFEISPKIYANKNLSCEYCPYKSICYVKESDYIYLRGDEDE